MFFHPDSLLDSIELDGAIQRFVSLHDAFSIENLSILIDSIENKMENKCIFHRFQNSITSAWSGSWILLQKEKRRLFFYNVANVNLECMDLRKARCLVLKESDDSIKNLHVESGPTLMIDCPPHTMYFIMTSPRETKVNTTNQHICSFLHLNYNKYLVSLRSGAI